MIKRVLLEVCVLSAILAPVTLQAQVVQDVDFDVDGEVGFSDFLEFSRAFGSSQSRYDLNRDGAVGFSDFLAFIRFFGQSSLDLPTGSGQRREIAISMPTSFQSDDVQMHFVWIEPGTYIMGTLPSEPGHVWEEAPRHLVTLTKGFYLGKYEVTQAQWEAVMGTRPWEKHLYGPSHSDYPAGYLSWNDAQAFIDRLNASTGFGGSSDLYRLPTEAEWEYAARAGTRTMWSFGDDESRLKDYAWYRDNAWDIGEEHAHRVGQKKPNPWGLYDMHGNVYEWVGDWWQPYSGPYHQIDPTGPEDGRDRVLRSGDFKSPASHSRSGFRNCGSPIDPYIGKGLRVARDAD